MNWFFYVFGCNCNVVFRTLYFQQFAAGRPYVVYLSFAGSIGPLNDNDAVASKQKKKRPKSIQTEEESYSKIFCLTVSCFAHNYVCLTAKFACSFLRVKSNVFTFCRDNLFDSVMRIFSVEFVVLCFQVPCFFLRVWVVVAAFTCLKTALGA